MGRKQYKTTIKVLQAFGSWGLSYHLTVDFKMANNNMPVKITCHFFFQPTLGEWNCHLKKKKNQGNLFPLYNSIYVPVISSMLDSPTVMLLPDWTRCLRSYRQRKSSSESKWALLILPANIGRYFIFDCKRWEGIKAGEIKPILRCCIWNASNDQ